MLIGTCTFKKIKRQVLIKLKTIVLQEVEVQLYFILFLYGAYTSIISQADADAKALNDLTNAQNFANT
jgi:hypothetical protein